MKSRFRKKGFIIMIAIIAVIMLSAVWNQICLFLENRKPVMQYGQMLEIEGEKFCVNTQGDGEKNIVILSGWGTASPVLDFKPLTEKLKSDYTVTVIEGLGYGRSGDTDEIRTVENITDEIHTVISNLGFDSYILMGHSISGIYMLSYGNQFENEVEAIIGIDPSVPEQLDRMDSKLELLQQGGNVLLDILGKTGIMRIASKVSPAVLTPTFSGGDALTQEEAEAYRTISLHRLCNKTVMDEFNQMEPSCDRMGDMRYPAQIPVLYFLSSESVDSMDWWYEIHENQLRGEDNKSIVILEGGHYLHHTQSQAIADQIGSFLSEP